MTLAGACRSCQAPVLWLVNEQTGGRAPIDTDPTPDGNIQVDVPRGTYRVLAGFVRDEAAAGDQLLHTSHFKTCPQRASWRRGR